MAAEEKLKKVQCQCPYCDGELSDAYPPYCNPCSVELDYCPECRKPVKREDEKCPHCGAAIKG